MNPDLARGIEWFLSRTGDTEWRKFNDETVLWGRKVACEAMRIGAEFVQ